jgi:hypothetical protein
MNDRKISLKLKVTSDSENKKATVELTKLASKWEQIFGPKGDKLVVQHTKKLVTLEGQWKSLTRAIDVAGEHFRRGFSSGQELGVTKGLSFFSRGVDGAVKKVINLKTLLAATAIGGAAIWAGHALYEEGMQNVKTRNKLKREFGANGDNEFIETLGRNRQFKSGVQDDDFERALIPFAREAQVIEKGAQFRGMKKSLTEAEATALRRKNLTFASTLVQRQIALHPEMEPEEVGKVLSDALSGPTGARQMVSAFGLGRRATKFMQANEQGKLYKMLSPTEQKTLNVSKAGQYAQQGDLVKLLLEKGGESDAAFEAMQKSFGHQIRQMKATAFGTLGDIGAEALDELTKKLGNGATAAERLQKYLASDEGKKTVLDIKDAVVGIGSGIGDIAKSLPAIGAWLKEHKTLVEGLALAYGVSKVATPAFKTGKGLFSIGKWAAGGGAGAFAKGAGGVLLAGAKVGLPLLAAGAAGYGIGTGIDWLTGKATGRSLSDRLAGAGPQMLDRGEENRQNEFSVARVLAKKVEAGKLTPEQAANQFSTFSRVTEHGKPGVFAETIQKRLTENKLEDISVGRLDAILADSTKPIEITIHNTTTLDGKAIAKSSERHQVRDIKARTANGAAPASRE